MIDRRRFLNLSVAAGLAPVTLTRADPTRADEDFLRMRDLYEKDESFTPLAKRREDSQVTVRGYMAPPLKANSTFFVLTKRPMAVCPFCETEAEWPDDILAVYTRRIFDPVPFNRPIVVTGELELGTERDQETGFVSRVRIANARFDYA